MVCIVYVVQKSVKTKMYKSPQNTAYMTKKTTCILKQKQTRVGDIKRNKVVLSFIFICHCETDEDLVINILKSKLEIFKSLDLPTFASDNFFFLFS